jgi:hypothetical protein
VVSGTLSSAAEVRMSVYRGTSVVDTTEWQVRDAGRIEFVWEDGTSVRDPAPLRVYRILVEARSPTGQANHSLTLVLIPDGVS